MKTLFLLIFFVPVLSSCFTYRNLTSGGSVTEDVVFKIRTCKNHIIKYKSGEVIKVFITHVDSATVYGNVFQKNGKSVDYPYSETIKELQRNAISVSERKFNYFLTIGIILAGQISIYVMAENMSFE